MKKGYLTVVVLLSIILVGCTVGTATYVQPIVTSSTEQYSMVISDEFDNVWMKLIEYAGSTFFTIDNYEKDSGLVTLSFGAANPSEFITGGHWKTSISNFDGDYVDYLTLYYNGKLTGRMNIVVLKISEEETRVNVNARYIFSSQHDTWAFNTGSYDTIMVTNPAAGTEPQRTLCPTHKAEEAVLNALDRKQ